MKKSFILLLIILISSVILINCKQQDSQDVNSVIKTKGINTTVYTAGGPNAADIFILSNSNIWADFYDLSITFNLSVSASVMVHYEIAMHGSGSHLVTRLVVDGNIVSRSLTGDSSYWSEDSCWYGELAADSHTIRIQYRTPAGGTSNPSASDWENRILQVLVFGS